jgi:hypothetical protein
MAMSLVGSRTSFGNCGICVAPMRVIPALPRLAPARFGRALAAPRSLLDARQGAFPRPVDYCSVQNNKADRRPSLEARVKSMTNAKPYPA